MCHWVRDLLLAKYLQGYNEGKTTCVLGEVGFLAVIVYTTQT